MTTPMQTQPALPYKSVAAALLFSVILGPVGLLYASFWGGLFMILISLFVVSNKFFFITLLIWLACCIWSVGTVDAYNRKIMNKYLVARLS
ncbi:hypothetical protein AQUSIP_15850 [Aquicella siphonis]|uniref:Uncharacterized protein n=1 Tax=Aquicella siphonis TaxID=254247 RepID=A0A5E4PIZ6_9COXI|nr:hypothetical protein [Aquicella siphonis]VVC76276.1 hypothetical protein AQUSIP_15850 [Aquicella siphonis]